MKTEIKTPIEIINIVEPNGELLTTEMAIEAMQIYHDQFKKHEIKTAGEPEKYPLVRAFLLKKYPTRQYFDCPVSKEYYEVMQEYANQFKVGKEVAEYIFAEGWNQCTVSFISSGATKTWKDYFNEFKNNHPELFGNIEQLKKEGK